MERKNYYKTAAVLTAFFLSAAFAPMRAEASQAGEAQSTAEPGEIEDIREYIIPITAQGEVVSDVFVRMGPSRDYEVMGTVREKDKVGINGRTYDGWYRIEFEGQAGFVYGDYLTVTQEELAQEPASDEEETKEPEPEVQPAEDETGQEDVEEPPSLPDSEGIDWGYLKLAAVVLIVAMIVAMIILIMRSLLQASRSDNIGGDERSGRRERKKPEEGKKANKRNAEAKDTVQDAAADGQAQERGASSPEEARTIIIREEDYQLHIDPKYFEDEPLSQPDYVTDYMKKMERQDTRPMARKEHTDDLKKAMKKLEELQEEIERLKKK